jgi:hypothetical protein
MASLLTNLNSGTAKLMDPIILVLACGRMDLGKKSKCDRIALRQQSIDGG